MLLLRCTNKVLRLMGQRPRQADLDDSQTGLHEWYVNLVDWPDDRYFVFTNPDSLYTLVLRADPSDGIAGLAGGMLRQLALHLGELEIERSRVERFIRSCDRVLVAKTASRSVLGSMHGLITNLCWLLGRQMDEQGAVDLRAAERDLNAMPQGPLDWRFARERFAELCSSL